jgi:5-methylcytosine-specific restriction endonuclease McrA
MKKVSSKQAEANKRIKKAYKVIRDTMPHYCTGCGRGDIPLSFSHLIPRSRRKDLEAEISNITYHCLSMGGRKGCHEIWESRDRYMLLDYHKNLEYILEVDAEYYFLITELNA